jgi:hypothetical protein
MVLKNLKKQQGNQHQRQSYQLPGQQVNTAFLQHQVLRSDPQGGQLNSRQPNLRHRNQQMLQRQIPRPVQPPLALNMVMKDVPLMLIAVPESSLWPVLLTAV